MPVSDGVLSIVVVDPVDVSVCPAAFQPCFSARRCACSRSITCVSRDGFLLEYCFPAGADVGVDAKGVSGAADGIWEGLAEEGGRRGKSDFFY